MHRRCWYAPEWFSDGDTAPLVAPLVREALDKLPPTMVKTLETVTYTDTIDQAAELAGIDVWAMALRRESAFAAFEAAFDIDAAEKLGILREPYRPARSYPRPAWKHYRDRCPICLAPVRTRYVGGLKCARCNRPMPLQRVRRGKPKRFCSGRCQRTAYNQKPRRSPGVPLLEKGLLTLLFFASMTNT